MDYLFYHKPQINLVILDKNDESSVLSHQEAYDAQFKSVSQSNQVAIYIVFARAFISSCIRNFLEMKHSLVLLVNMLMYQMSFLAFQKKQFQHLMIQAIQIIIHFRELIQVC